MYLLKQGSIFDRNGDHYNRLRTVFCNALIMLGQGEQVEREDEIRRESS